MLDRFNERNTRHLDGIDTVYVKEKTKKELLIREDLISQDIVIEGIIKDLNRIKIRSNISKKSILRLKNIQHLKTSITAKTTNNINIINILDTISPTPALSGYPKKESLKIIAELENYDRGWYSGAIGWIDSELDCDFFAFIKRPYCRLLLCKLLALFL